MPLPEWKPIHDGAQLLARVVAPSMDEALDVARELILSRPEGTYPWRVELQKSPKGARTTVTVSLQVAGRERPRREADREG